MESRSQKFVAFLFCLFVLDQQVFFHWLLAKMSRSSRSRLQGGKSREKKLPAPNYRTLCTRRIRILNFRHLIRHTVRPRKLA